MENRHGIGSNLVAEMRHAANLFRKRMFEIWRSKKLRVGRIVEMHGHRYIIKARAHDGYVRIQRKDGEKGKGLMSVHPNDVTVPPTTKKK
ncbi:MAG: hypothetical protein V4449_00525 [Patescibacteria group bacterium]